MGECSTFWKLLLNTACLARLHGEAARGSALVSAGTAPSDRAAFLPAEKPSASTRTCRSGWHIAGSNHYRNPI
jgi:hypothetical protein